MNIVFDALEKEAEDYFRSVLSGHTLTFLPGRFEDAPPDILAAAEVISVFVSSPLTAELIAAMPRLRLIAARSMGYDHIDIGAARARSVVVSTVPAYGARTVAEFTFALILALSRKAYAAFDRLREEGTTDVKDFEGFDLAGKTIGIIGTGHIGQNVARIACGFDMRIILCDNRPNEALASEIHAEYKPLGTLVAESDIITLHIPYLPATHHYINESVLSKCKRGSYLINTARGGIVETKALIRALQDGRLAGAGLDVLEGERALLDELSLLYDDHHDINEFRELVAAHALVDMPNVIVTPHIAFNSREAKREINTVTTENITAFVAGSSRNNVAV